MSPWRVLVTIHNVVNVPRAACENGPRSFLVEAHMVQASADPSAPVVASMFTTEDVVSSTPNLFEVRLDDVARCTDTRGKSSSKLWPCAVPEFEVVVIVKELVPGTMISSFPYLPSCQTGGVDPDSARVVGTSAPVLLNAREIVDVHKLTTRIIGTEMGQVGLSFTVDPDDKVGYRRRLENFLQEYNPQGLRLVPNVVEVVSELDTFTKLYRRYSLQNYEERLTSFFDVYGPQYKSEIPSLLRQWEGREEELMRNLVLDNGPELTTIDQRQRLTAYLAAYQLDRSSPSVKEILSAHVGRDERDIDAGVFSALVSRYGPEPDPRTYLFSTPRYTPPLPQHVQDGGVSMRSRGRGNTSSYLPHNSPRLENSNSVMSSAAAVAAPQRSAPKPVSEQACVSVSMSPTPIANRDLPSGTARSHGRSPRFAAHDSPPGGGRMPVMPGERHEEKRAISPGDQGVGVETTARANQGDIAAVHDASLWYRMCAAMQAQQRHLKPWQEHLLFFLDQDEFAAAVRALHVFSETPSGGEVRVLVEEWLRRVDHAFRIETLGSNDAYYGAAVQEALRLTGLQPLHLQVVSVGSVFHKEQYSGFAAYVEGQAKRSKTERLALVGEWRQLMNVARFGLHTAGVCSGPYAGAQASPETVHNATGTKGDGPFIFSREPFRNCTERHSCAILVCDVAVGETYSCPTAMHAPHRSTTNFLAQYDSCAYVDEANGPVVAVYFREQVMPRRILQCVIDPKLQPCPAHPDRPVEYYVMESHAFACSRCVVLGAYRGKEVTPIEEAVVMARTGLGEVERTANALRESMLAYTNHLQNEESSMPTAPRHVEAEREIARLQRETEERIDRIRRQQLQEDEVQLSRIRAERVEVQATLEAVDELSERLRSAMHQCAPIDTVNALRHIQQEGQVEQLMARAQERVPSAALELVLPLDGQPPTHPPRSSRSKGHAKRSSEVVVGLNESRLPEASTDGNQQTRGPRPAASSSSPAPHPRPTTHAASLPSSLYAQYLSIAASDAPTGASQVEQQSFDSTRHLHGRPHPVSVTAGGSSDGRGEMGILSAKEALTRGWALLRRGDLAAAHRAWAGVCSSHGTDNVMGTKAHAYIAEAIEKDYAAAAKWYARSLQLDPHDRMTAYNYGVLLEALLNKPQEALRLYDRAAALGDTVAAARARELRSTLSPSSRH